MNSETISKLAEGLYEDRKKFEDNFKRLTLGGTSCEGVFHSSWNVSDRIMIESYYI